MYDGTILEIVIDLLNHVKKVRVETKVVSENILAKLKFVSSK